MSEAAAIEDYILQRYDELCDWSEIKSYYGGSNFLNFGYWRDDTRTQKEACENLMQELLDLIPHKSGKILDVACGKGETSGFLTRAYPIENIVAINISPHQLDIARSHAPGIDFRLMNATELEFEDNTFDNIICVEAAFHFYTRENFFKEALRVLKPGGSIVLCDVLMTLEAERNRESRTEKNYLEDPGAYLQCMERNGYTDVHVRDVTTQSWDRHYWYTVKYVHQQFLEGKFSEETLVQMLKPTYGRVPDMQYYLLASGRKPE
jgi:MPBQ/MSBQ methyltransferase